MRGSWNDNVDIVGEDRMVRLHTMNYCTGYINRLQGYRGNLWAVEEGVNAVVNIEWHTYPKVQISKLGCSSSNWYLPLVTGPKRTDSRCEVAPVQ